MSETAEGGRRLWLSIVGAATLVHIVLAAVVPLSSDEMYFWDTSRHPDWSYHDQPPLAAWSAIPFRMVLGESRLAVRGPAILASLVVALVLVPFARRLGGGEREAAVAYALLHATPIFFLGSFYFSTDTLMVPAYLTAVWAAVRIADGDRRSWWLFGIATGIGFLAKFTIVLVLPVIAAALAARPARRDLGTTTPYLAAGVSLALTAPVWIWAAQHGGANLELALSGRHVTGGLTARYLLELAAASLVLLTPFTTAALAVAWWRSRGRGVGWLVVRVGAVVPLVFVVAVGLTTRVSPHWGLTGVPAGVVLVALVAFPGRRALAAAGGATCAALCAAVLVIVAAPERLLAVEWSYGGRPDDLSTRKLADLIGNREIHREVERRRRPGELVGSESFTWVHGLAFYSGGTLETRLGRLRGGVTGLASLYWHRPEELVGADMLWVTTKDDMRPKLEGVFRQVLVEPPIEIVRSGRVVRTVRLYRCRHLEHAAGIFSRLSSRTGDLRRSGHDGGGS